MNSQNLNVVLATSEELSSQILVFYTRDKAVFISSAGCGTEDLQVMNLPDVVSLRLSVTMVKFQHLQQVI